MGKNYIEAYIEYKKQLIILVSGLPGCGKNVLTSNIANDFKLKKIDQHDYYLEGYNNKQKLPNDVEVTNWYSDDAIDWVKLNKDINSHKKQGVILTGTSLVADKLDFDPDFHIHLSISKKVCMDKRTKYFTKNKDKFKIDFELIGSATEKLLMNRLLFPYYLETIKRSKIDKFINGNELSNEQIYDNAFSYLVDHRIHNFLHKERFQKKILEGTLSPYEVEKLPENYPDESDTSEIQSYDEPIKVPTLYSDPDRIKIPVLSESPVDYSSEKSTEETPEALKEDSSEKTPEESSEEVDPLRESSTDN